MNSTRPHVIPIGDKYLHIASEKCWCHPINKDGVVVHNAKDCREVSERQNVETGKIWVEVLESYQRETKPSAEDEPLQLLRRIGTPKAFMDLEGVRIICADFMAKWDARNS